MKTTETFHAVFEGKLYPAYEGLDASGIAAILFNDRKVYIGRSKNLRKYVEWTISKVKNAGTPKSMREAFDASNGVYRVVILARSADEILMEKTANTLFQELQKSSEFILLNKLNPWEFRPSLGKTVATKLKNDLLVAFNVLEHLGELSLGSKENGQNDV